MQQPTPWVSSQSRRLSGSKHKELIREDLRRAEQEKLEALLIQGLESGEPVEVSSPEFWESKRQALLARHSRKSGS